MILDKPKTTIILSTAAALLATVVLAIVLLPNNIIEAAVNIGGIIQSGPTVASGFYWAALAPGNRIVNVNKASYVSQSDTVIINAAPTDSVIKNFYLTPAPVACTGTIPSGAGVILGPTQYIAGHTPTYWQSTSPMAYDNAIPNDPTNSTYGDTYACKWKCNSGYSQSGNNCVVDNNIYVFVLRDGNDYCYKFLVDQRTNDSTATFTSARLTSLLNWSCSVATTDSFGAPSGHCAGRLQTQVINALGLDEHTDWACGFDASVVAIGTLKQKYYSDFGVADPYGIGNGTTGTTCPYMSTGTYALERIACSHP